MSDGVTPTRLPALLTLCKQEEPGADIRSFKIPLSQQIKGLHDDLYDVVFAQSDEFGNGICAEPAWSDPLMVAVPARHPLLIHQRMPLDAVLRYPLTLCVPQIYESYSWQVARVLRTVDREPLVGEQVTSFDLMTVLVSVGFAFGLAGASQIAASHEFGIRFTFDDQAHATRM